MNHQLGCELAARKRLPQLLSLRVASGARNTNAQRARHDMRHLARRERVAHHVRDHIRRVLRLAGAHGAARADGFAEHAA